MTSMDKNIFTEQDIISMNRQPLWNGQITLVKYKLNDRYFIHAINGIGINGRKYVALPVNVNINNMVIDQYNIFN